MEVAGRYEIRIGVERLIAIRDELARFVQRVVRGKRIHNSTAYRWALRGVRGRRLPTARIGGRLFTSEGAFSWWASMLAQDLGEQELAEQGGRAPEPSVDVAEVLRRAGIKG